MRPVVLEKFPKLFLRERRLIWDSRQAPGQAAELVFVPNTHISQEVRRGLLGRPNARFVLAHDDHGSGVAEDLIERVDDPRRALGLAAAEALGHPSRRLSVLAVTGTNGKTTCAGLLRALVQSAGFRVAEIGTLGLSVWEPTAQIPTLTIETGFTTPEAPTLHHLFAQLADSGITHVAMEVSSHGLELGRVEGVEFSGALFTNLTQDHLDLHGTMEAYENAKGRLFRELLPWSKSRGRAVGAVFNGVTSAGERIFRDVEKSYPATLLREGREYFVEASTLSGLRLSLRSLLLESPMVGRFHAENIAGAVELARLVLGLDESSLRDGIARFHGASGRLERVPDKSSRERAVFVDYAHTPDAVVKALAALREVSLPSARLHVVLGCGGDRDRLKRPMMARAAMAGADRVYLTSDNPRSEDPERILDDMAAGLEPADFTRCERIVDRSKAIHTAIKALGAGDVCLVAGKGHESYQIVGSVKLPFSDVAECTRALS